LTLRYDVVVSPICSSQHTNVCNGSGWIVNAVELGSRGVVTEWCFVENLTIEAAGESVRVTDLFA
jgi:hypothetical protein